MKGGGSSTSGGAAVVEHLTFTANAGDSDPRSRAVLFAGQLPNLHKLAWSQVKGKLEPRVTQEVARSPRWRHRSGPGHSAPLAACQPVTHPEEQFETCSAA